MVLTKNAENIIKQLPTGIIRWYPFKEGKSILYLGDADAIFSCLKEKNGDNVSIISIARLSSIKAKRFDYIVCIGYLEKVQDIQGLFSHLKTMLSPGGRLLLGMNNRLGLRYFCGDKDVHTGQVIDGLDDYFRAYNKAEDSFNGRSYDKAQLQGFLGKAGFTKQKYYSVFSGLENPNIIISEDYLPNENLCTRLFPSYNDPTSLFMEEKRLYSGLIENGMFHNMANAFFIECGMRGKLSDALQITNSLDRGKEHSIITVIHDNDTVTKQAAYMEGEKSLLSLCINSEKLRLRGIDTVDGILKNGIYTMPFVHALTGQVYLEELLRNDKEQFIKKMDEFRELLISSSDISKGFYKEPVPKKETEKEKKSRIYRHKKNWEGYKESLLKEGMIDMVPLNTMYVNNHFVFMDQEYCVPNLPVDVLVSRMIFTFFNGNPDMIRLMDPDVLYKRYGVPNPATEGGNKYLEIEFRFFDQIMNRRELADFYKTVREDASIINANRHRMNFSTDDYQRLFVDIFEHADDRKLILFGSGIFARRFLALYGQDYKVHAVVDNNERRWGERLYPEGFEPKRDMTGGMKSERDASNASDSRDLEEESLVKDGIEISSPEILNELRHGEFKIIICIKNYLSVMKQLDSLGINEYSIFDPSKAYQRKRHPISLKSLDSFEHSTVPEGGKKYHVGYIAGVFDLYHVGHLNMFRRAKEMCDYLIVGVVSDEGVRRFKQVDPFVPFDERIEMVKSCRYVDEAVEIPYMYGGTEDAWRMHHFDVQFSGSDYVNDPNFERYRDFLEKHGATMEFFPYTQSTSSTKLKSLIDKKLI